MDFGPVEGFYLSCKNIYNSLLQEHNVTVSLMPFLNSSFKQSHGECCYFIALIEIDNFGERRLLNLLLHVVFIFFVFFWKFLSAFIYLFVYLCLNVLR